jgi:hypothetical protein
MATVLCPQGHASTTTDYCDTCGAPIAPPATSAPAAGEGGGGAAATPPAEAGAAAGATGTAASGPGADGPRPCPGCGEPVLSRFCEECGYDVESGTPVAAATVSLVLGADRAHWDRMVGSGEPAFPTEVPTLTFKLEDERAMLGRVRDGASAEGVDLALTGTAADPAVSHNQCLFRREGAHWAVVDAGSANGTWVNDATHPLATGMAHTLVHGDRVFIGAYTCLTVQFDPPPPTTPPPVP